MRRLLLATLLSTSTLLAGCQVVFAPDKSRSSIEFSTDGGIDGSGGGDGDGDDASTRRDGGGGGSDPSMDANQGQDAGPGFDSSSS